MLEYFLTVRTPESLLGQCCQSVHGTAMLFFRIHIPFLEVKGELEFPSQRKTLRPKLKFGRCERIFHWPWSSGGSISLYSPSACRCWECRSLAAVCPGMTSRSKCDAITLNLRLLPTHCHLQRTLSVFWVCLLW